MATGMQVWSIVPVSNATADSNVNWAEQMAPSQVNDSARAVMASAAKWVADNSGSLVTSGTTSALTVATNQVEAALTTGFTVTATLGSAVAAAATLAVDGLAAVPIFTSLSSASALTTGQLALGQVTSFVYTTGITGAAQAWVVKAASPSVTSIAPLLNVLTKATTADITVSGGAGVYTDGPSVAQGTTGIWYASGTLTFGAPGNTQPNVKLWDGTTVMASGGALLLGGDNLTVSLSGIITNPAGNIKMSAASATTSTLKFNFTGNSADCTLTAFRIG